LLAALLRKNPDFACAYVEMDVMLKICNFSKRLVILNIEKEIQRRKYLWHVNRVIMDKTTWKRWSQSFAVAPRPFSVPTSAAHYKYTWVED
jgi:hypothetical protein